MIKGLPPKNLDRVVELVERGKPAEKRSHDNIFVDLEKEVQEKPRDAFYEITLILILTCVLHLQSNVTLWRLYYYVQAVEKARKLSR